MMKILQSIFIITMVFANTNSYGQGVYDYFIKQTGDTVLCSNLKFATNSRGELNFLRYTQLDSAEIVYQSKKTAPFVLTLFIDGKTIDRIPLTPNSKRQVRYTERKIDGRLKVYLVHQDNSNSKDATVMYIFYLKMPDKSFYKINNKKNMQNVIIPFLNKCQGFTDEYKGDYSNKEDAFIEMIELYNHMCP